MATESVTVLFTDLVGSTELISRVGEDRAEVLRRDHFALLREAIHDGHGREVKNLGDGLMVAFDSVTGALACAVSMQQRVDIRNRSADEMFAIRIGVSHGEADIEDDDYFGVPVVEAARLCAHAHGDQILTTELVRTLAGSRGGLQFESIGSVQLKGLDDAVAACTVVWTSSRTDASVDIVLPARLDSAGPAAFVGRVTERDRLEAVLKSVGGGERRVVLVSGEPGIGKTSLSSAFARAAHADGAVVLYGRSDEDLGIPYQPWGEALGHLVAHVDRKLLLDHVARRSGRLANLVPDLANRVALPAEDPSTDAEAERYLLFGDIIELLRSVSEITPILLILDDLHWADKPSVQLLRHVVTASVPLHVMILATFRDSEVGAEHPLADALVALHREPGVERLTMQGLDDVDLLALMEAIAGHEMDEEGVALRDALSRETDGNPFFVAEILRHLADTGAIRLGDDGHWIASAEIRAEGLPVSVREVVGQRVKRLGPAAVAALSTAAVIGREFDLELLEAAAQVPGDELLDILDGAIAAGLLEEIPGRVGRYSFAHALIEHTLYHDLTANRRARLHRTVAQCLEELCGDHPGARLGELAWHWSEATVAVDLDKPVRYAQQAAEWALEQLAPDESIRWFQHALELLAGEGEVVDDERRCSLLVGLGEAQRQVGDRAYRETLLDAAEIAQRIDSSDLLVRSALANNRGIFSALGEVDEPRLEVLRAALAVEGPSAGGATRAKLLALLAVESMFDSDFTERQALVLRAVEAARATHDPSTIAEVLARTHVAIQVPENLEARLALTTEAWDRAREVRDPFVRWLTETVRMNAALDVGDIVVHDRCFADAVASAERLGQPHPLWEARFSASTRAMLHGDSGEAERFASEGLEFALKTGEPDALTIFGVQIVGIRWQQGRLDEIVPLIRDAVAQQPRIPAFRALLAFALANTGALEEVREMVAVARDAEFAFPYDFAWLSASTVFAECAARVGDRAAARILFDRLEPWSAHVANVSLTSWGAVAHHLGLLATCLDDYDAAERFFAQALELHAAIDAPFFTARTQTELANMLNRRAAPGDEARSTELRAAASATAHALGYAGLERALLS